MAAANKCINYINNSEKVEKINKNLITKVLTKGADEAGISSRSLNGATKASSITLDERLSKDVNGVFPKRRLVPVPVI